MAWHPSGRASVNARSPSALAICDRCGFTYNLRALSWQHQWAGPELQNLQKLVCRSCLDVPQQQLRSIILPPDPRSVMPARPEQYAIAVPSFIATESTALSGDDLTTEGGDNLVWEITNTPDPDPRHPADYP